MCRVVLNRMIASPHHSTQTGSTFASASVLAWFLWWRDGEAGHGRASVRPARWRPSQARAAQLAWRSAHARAQAGQHAHVSGQIATICSIDAQVRCDVEDVARIDERLAAAPFDRRAQAYRAPVHSDELAALECWGMMLVIALRARARVVLLLLRAR